MQFLRAIDSEQAYVDLFVCPAVHTERLDFGNMGAELPVDGRTSHAEEYAQLIGKVQLLV